MRKLLLLALFLCTPPAWPQESKELPDPKLYPSVPLAKIATKDAWPRPRALIAGKVTLVKKEDDGDHHFVVIEGEHKVICEIIPELPLTPPKVGDTVKVWGIPRWDGEHKWGELHPVTGLKVEGGAKREPADEPMYVDTPAPPTTPAEPTFAELDKAQATIKAFNDALKKHGLPPLEVGRPGPPGPAGPPGKDGAPGPMGPMPDHETDGKRIRFQRPGGAWGPWIDLGGNGPPPPPDPTPTGKIAFFVVVEDTLKSGKWRGDILGSPQVEAWYRQFRGPARTGTVHLLVDINGDGADSQAAQAYRKLAAGKQLPWLFQLDAAGKIVNGGGQGQACPTASPEAFIAAFDQHVGRRSLGLVIAKPKLKWKEFGTTPATPIIPRAMWTEMSLKTFLPPVYDQDGIGQCAPTSAIEIAEAARAQAGLPYIHLSAGDLYDRVNGGNDNGSTLEDCLAELTTNGVAPVSASSPFLWKRGQSRNVAVGTRAPYRVVEAYLCTSFDAMASAVQQGFFLHEGLVWYDNFDPDSNGWLPARGAGGSGGHALLGYGLAKRTDGSWGLKTRNSWSATWGIAGDCIIPESLFNSQIGGWWAVRAVVQTPDSNFPMPSLSLRKTPFAGADLILAP